MIIWTLVIQWLKSAKKESLGCYPKTFFLFFEIPIESKCRINSKNKSHTNYCEP